MIDRSVRPPVFPVNRINLSPPDKVSLKNGIQVFSFDLADQELVKVEVVFRTGTAHQKQNLVAEFATKMMREGTASRTASEIANQIDFYGAFLEHNVSKDFTSFSLYCLTKYINQSLQVFADIIKNPVFPEEELNILLRNGLQKFQVNSDKVSVLCRREFATKLYNPKHPYYSSISADDFSVDRLELSDYYNSNLNLGSADIFISGRVNTTIIEAVEREFGSVEIVEADAVKPDRIDGSEPGHHLIEREGAIQSGIRIGKLMPFTRLDDDYVPFSILNTALGGYFSSRLMANIREDKGYTYGIGSGLIASLASTTFLISTEVNVASTQATLDEITKEIKILQNEKIPHNELERVKSYMVGSFLRNTDGPFDVCERFKSTHLFEMDYDYYNHYLARLQEVTAEEVREVAVRYLQLDSMLEVVAGAK